MKKLVVLLALVGFVGCAFSTPAMAVIQNTNEKGQISVNTTANKEIAPDVVEITFAVQTYDTKSMQNATLENKKISKETFYSTLYLFSLSGKWLHFYVAPDF